MKRDSRSRSGQIHRAGKRMSRSERIQMKALICILGILLLAVLLGGRILMRLLTPKEEPAPQPEPHIPVVQELHNVWIMEAGEEKLLLFRDGTQERYSYGMVETEVEGERGKETGLQLYQPDRSIREQVADVVLTDGLVTGVRVKNEKIHGTVLSADDTSIEIEGYGKLPLATDFRGYRIYNTLAMCTQGDLAFGYDFTDFVLENGEICGILMVREESMEHIRVLVKTADYAELLHREVTLTADTDFVIRYGGYDSPAEELHAAGDEVTIACDSAYFQGGRIVVTPTVLTGKVLLKNVGRSQGVPGYRGHLELVPEEEGFAVVNAVPLEEYLYSVVPSEMPAAYPAEALKAQAICARTYAYGHMKHAAYPAYGAHVDDSTAYQVYNNISEQESTTTAVKETYGQLLYTGEGELAGTYYYSTSCGVGSDANVWKTEAAKAITYLRGRAVNESSMQESQDIGIGEYLRDEDHFKDFITSVNPGDFEAEEGWYRWTYRVKELDPEYLCEVLKKRYQVNPRLVLTLKDEEYVSQEIEDFEEIREIYMAARGEGGVADELVLETDSGTYKVISEHNIRYVLCDGRTKVKRQNGSFVEMPNLLPSGFFIIETGKKNGNVVGYTLTGGGFGHGAGMSQNAAKAMAKKGYAGEDILLFFYDGCVLQNIY